MMSPQQFSRVSSMHVHVLFEQMLPFFAHVLSTFCHGLVSEGLLWNDSVLLYYQYKRMYTPILSSMTTPLSATSQTHTLGNRGLMLT